MFATAVPTCALPTSLVPPALVPPAPLLLLWFLLPWFLLPWFLLPWFLLPCSSCPGSSCPGSSCPLPQSPPPPEPHIALTKLGSKGTGQSVASELGSFIQLFLAEDRHGAWISSLLRYGGGGRLDDVRGGGKEIYEGRGSSTMGLFIPAGGREGGAQRQPNPSPSEVMMSSDYAP